MRGRDIGPRSHCCRKGRTKVSEAGLIFSESLMRPPTEEAGAMNEITHEPSAPTVPIAADNAQWNDNPVFECPAHSAGVQVHLCLKGWHSFSG